jgi:hypothetical protein
LGKFGKPQMSTSTLNTIKMKPTVMEVISLIDAVPGLFFCKRAVEIG